MKKFSAPAVTSVLWNTFAVFGVLVVAGVVGVAIAGAFAFHQLNAGSDHAKAHQARVHTEPLPPMDSTPAPPVTVQPVQPAAVDRDAEPEAGVRPAAAEPSDNARFTYADYHIDVSRIPAATFVRGKVSDILPPPLNPTAEPPGNSFSEERHMPSLSDPGSHYIIDSRTGRVIGIDGTAGAVTESRQQQRLQAAQVETPARPKPVLAAIPVDAPADGDLPPPRPDLYVPVRRALPVIEISHGQPFDAATEVADDSRPVMRATPVITTPPARPAQRVVPLP